ncbi:DNA-binding transcriptional LysR family regulator [Leucobacter exalbidus]|uniref:DNA-binding transcriptional LysR family regulator n=1 Tax=Leucobacter exalbidus TaxID=662960 RepID=A0A940PW41_9MICO|nr:LysR family transcriptional regulator [Leucobacter exalbidus]MBP1327320.1 DNA-binding transcriptional LysR family regulator [Leucobacter exalbidus]
MEISQVRAFLAVAEELHFGRAADDLRIAQPQLSRTIRQLEVQLGGRLFERSTRRVSLTALGQTVRGPMKAVMQAVDSAEAAARAAVEGKIGRVRIGFGGISSHEVMGQVARLVRSEQPGIQLEIDGNQFGVRALESVANGDLDLAIVRFDREVPGISMRVMGRERFVLAVPEGSPLALVERITFADLAGEWFVTLPSSQGSALANALLMHAHRAGFVPKIAQIAPDSRVAMVLVAAGVGVSLTVESVSERVRTPGVVFRELDQGLPTLEVRLAWRENASNPAAEAVLEMVERVMPDFNAVAAGGLR